ncbi:MAG: Transcriptional regulator CopG/Arc/MetJ family [Candidatus Methanohalarchaeum thermophilum]|uniref:Putative nickel-responsive regulator n=1 Tax=Methanohalarchaeum thermophilum TaxID=1903181 RepID=A0A1Q6DXE1_METT1|nr:MAG: Transcriptional regulator CopG/Arc/MetJ family [Candidatus Methanohalarchaeum thermophilum]
MTETERIGVSLDKNLLKKFDEKIEEKMYTNRSEAIRDLIRDFLIQKELEDSSSEVIGSLTVVYDHEVKGISDKLNNLQHEEHANVLSSLHIHLDKRYCMEILAIKGKAEEIRDISDRIIKSKGVKHGKLAMTSYKEP